MVVGSEQPAAPRSYGSGGAEAVRTTFRAPSHVILGCGLLLSSGTALVPVLLGGAVLEHGEIALELPIFGKVKLVSALPFDTGVLLVVVGLVLMLFAAFCRGLSCKVFGEGLNLESSWIRLVPVRPKAPRSQRNSKPPGSHWSPSWARRRLSYSTGSPAAVKPNCTYGQRPPPLRLEKPPWSWYRKSP